MKLFRSVSPAIPWALRACWSSLTVSLLLALAAATGCDESDANQARKQSARSVDVSGRVIQASRQKIIMTASEIEAAGEIDSPARFDADGQLTGSSRRDYTRVAQTVVGRLEDRSAISDFEDLIEQAQQLREEITAGQTDKIAVLSDRLTLASAKLMANSNAFDQVAADQNQQRLHKAQQTLQSALALANKTDQRTAKVGPELALGTLGCLLGRHGIQKMHLQELQIQKQQIALSGLAVDLMIEKTIPARLQADLPYDELTDLQTYLQGNPEKPAGSIPPLKTQLAAVERQLTDLEDQKKRIEQRIATSTDHASQLHAQYLDLLDRAEHLRGPQQYELERQAYEIRAGCPQADQSRTPGVLEYEAQTETAQAELAVVNDGISYLQLRRGQLRQIIAAFEQKLTQLQNSPSIAHADVAGQASQTRAAALLAQFHDGLEKLAAAETHYVELRLDTVTAFDKARKSYARAALGSRTAREYATQLAGLATAELADFWLSDARHYANAAAAVAALQHIPETADLISTMRTDYTNQAQQANDSAAELAPTDTPEQ